jgi:hypothetical protein
LLSPPQGRRIFTLRHFGCMLLSQAATITQRSGYRLPVIGGLEGIVLINENSSASEESNLCDVLYRYLNIYIYIKMQFFGDTQ